MAQVPRIALVKKGNAAPFKGRAAGAAATSDFVLIDNLNDTATISGVDAAGNPVDISNVATIAVTSSDTSILTIDPAPSGMTFGMKTTGKLTVAGSPVTITVVATWKDGSIGPFTATLPVDVVSGPAGSIVIQPGVPTIRV